MKQVCEKTEGIVSIANYNCPGQIVLARRAAVGTRAAESLKEAGAKRTVALKVSGPFHSKMLTGAGEKLGEALKEVELHAFSTPYITNVIADYVTSPAGVKELLRLQVSSSVRWQQSVERMIADGVDTFVEIGPGKTLSGFIEETDRSAKTLNIENMADFEKAMAELKGGNSSGRKDCSGNPKLQEEYGRAIALALAADEATVIVNYNGSAQKAEAVVTRLKRWEKTVRLISVMWQIPQTWMP